MAEEDRAASAARLHAPGRVLPSGSVTFCLTDIERSTLLLRSLGDDYPQLLARCRHLLASAFTSNGGVVVSTSGGDSMFAAFADPTAAVQGAVDAQVAIAANEWPEGATVRVRMGLHAGEAEPVAGDYAALAVHQAARVSAAAHGEQILVSDAVATVASPTGDGWWMEPVGRYRLRDFDRPERLWDVRHPALRNAPPPAAPPALPQNLPRTRGAFVGRQEELDLLDVALAADGVVTIVGPGGVGKTRLAVEAARRGDVRRWDVLRFVDLAPLSDGRDVERAIVDALVDDAPHLDDRLDVAVHNLQGRALLIVDNCEHVLAGAARAVDALLARCPDLTVLVTSRARLGLADERIIHLGPLPLPRLQETTARAVADADSVALFVERAARARVGFQLTDEDAAAVSAIVHRLDGTPLAIELAAALVAHHQPASIELQLREDATLSALDDAAGSRSSGRQTLEAVVRWSYDLLDAEARPVFRSLAVFADQFDDDAVAAIVGPNVTRTHVARQLRRLVERSLVTVESPADGHSAYGLLATVRSVTVGWLATEPGGSRLIDAHLQWALTIARDANAAYDRPAPSRASFFALLNRHHLDLRLALERQVDRDGRDGGAAVELALAVARHDEDIEQYARGWAVLVGAVERAPEAPPALLAQALRTLAVLAWRQQQHSDAVRLTEEAMRLAEQLGDEELLARCLNNLTAIASSQSDYAVARRYGQQALAITQRLGLRNVEAYTQNHLGVVARYEGAWDEAARRYEAARALARRVGDTTFEASFLPRLAALAWATGDYDAAAQLNQEGLDVARDLNRPRLELHCLVNLVHVAWADGRFDEARAWGAEARSRLEALDRPPEFDLELCLARVARAEGRLGEAATLLDRVLALSGASRLAALEVAEEAALLAAAAGDAALAGELAEGTAIVRRLSGQALEMPHAAELQPLRSRVDRTRFTGTAVRLAQLLPLVSDLVARLAPERDGQRSSGSGSVSGG